METSRFRRSTAVSTTCTYSRPLLAVRLVFDAMDGTFLMSAQRVTLLIAVVLDGNQKITMLAWALVKGENKDSWSWFLHNFLKSFLEWPHRDDTSIISDRDKGLIPAARDVLPLGIPHYFGQWHLH
ncbi:unnamed protein product [Closterium sp. NIES-54]